MNRILRQTALGFGTFGTGCALLAMNVNPYLLVLTDTVVGVGMLFAAGSLRVDDLKRRGGAGEGAAAGAEDAPGDIGEIPSGLRASLGKLRWSVKSPAGAKGKEEKEAQVKEIDRMLDATLAGGSKRLISLAEGQGAAPPSAGTAASAVAAPGHEEDLLQEFSKTEIGAPFGDEEEGEAGMSGQAAPAAGSGAGTGEARPATLPGAGEEAAQADVLSLSEKGLGADDLLSALRLEAMREKKKDDTSLLRDLKGVKVSGKELLQELDSLVRTMRGR